WCHDQTVRLPADVLAKLQGRGNGAFEAHFGRDGQVQEGSTSNVPVVRDRDLITPPEGPLLLSGVTRKVVLTVAQQAGVAVKEEPVTEADLCAADEVLLTGTTIEVLPVARVDGRPIGAGVPGPVTRLVMDRFKRALG